MDMEVDQASTGDKLQSFLQELASVPTDERTRILEGIMPLVARMKHEPQWKEFLSGCNLNLVFDCFDSKDEHELTVASEVLTKAAEIVDSSVMLERYTERIQHGYNHPNSIVKQASLRIFIKCVSKSNLSDIGRNGSLLTGAVCAIKESDLTVAKEAMSLAVLLSGDGNDDGLLFSKPLLSLFLEMSEDANEIVRLRVLETMMRIAKKSVHHFNRVVQHDFIGKLCKEVESEDVMVQLNALELLTDLADNDRGLHYLVDTGMLLKVDAVLDRVSSSPLANILLPGFVKLLAVASSHQKDCLQAYPHFRSVLVSLLEDGDVGQQIHALETVAHICRVAERKLELERNAFFNAVIPTLTRLFKSGTAESKVRALAVLADLIELHPGAMEQEEAKVNEDLMAGVDPSLLSATMDMAKQPFPDMASTVHVMFLKMACQKWGLEKFKAQAGFFELLLDRSVGSEKQVTDLKYEVIEKCVETDSAVAVIPADVLLKLKQYVKEGPYFGVSGLRVALDQE